MMYSRAFIVTFVGLALTMPITLQCHAIEVVLDTDADADIRSADLADLSYNRTVMVVGMTSEDPTAVRNYKAYMRFALPPNIDTVNSATFSVSRAVAGAWNFTYHLFGLNDGVPGETDWIESNTEGITWNTAPGNDPTSPSAFVDSTELGTFTVLGFNNGGVSGDTYTVETPALVDFLNADTNGYVTLMISRFGTPSTSTDQFKARTGSGPEYPGVPTPTLTLEYSISLTPGDFNEDGIVDGNDFMWWQRGLSPNPLSASDLSSWESNFGGGSAVTAIPEPTAFSMLLVGCAALGTQSMRRFPRR